MLLGKVKVSPSPAGKQTLKQLGRKNFSWNSNLNKHPDSRCPEFPQHSAGTSS